jgi:N-acetylglucosaminyl-diphospho-decaprenol L-rhamnosyltransferase
MVARTGAETMGPVELDVVYVNFNTTDLLLDSIASLRHHADRHAIAVRVVVVDNDSVSHGTAGLDNLPGDVELIRSPTNVGCGAACNRGAATGRAPFLLFLNPDPIVLPETLPGLLSVLRRHQGEVLAGPRQFADVNRVFTIAPMRGTTLLGDVTDTLHDRGWLPRRTLAWVRRRANVLERSDPVCVRELPGNALAVGRRAFERLGGFDARYFLYHEDADLCWRARALGLPCLYLPATGIVHWLERSTDTVRARAEQAIRDGRHVFLRRHYPPAWRGLGALALRAVKRLPAIRRRMDRAVDMDPHRPLPLPPAASGCRRVVELARSTLFDNGLTARAGGDRFCLPRGLHDRLFPGVYFVHVVVETRRNRWREHALYRLTRRTPAAPAPCFERPKPGVES